MSGQDRQEGAARWTADAVAGIARAPLPALPVITAADVVTIAPALDLWDMWPIQHRDGRTARFDGETLWMILAADRFADPVARHDVAHIRLFAEDGAGRWTDLGPALPERLSPGARQWSGSAVLGEDGRRVTLYFTAAGRRGGPLTIEQRQFETTATLDRRDGRLALAHWSEPRELFAPDGVSYAATGGPKAPFIPGFRDPGFFRDPATGAEHLVFTGSAVGGSGRYDGVIGRADRDGDGWALRPPLLSAAGLCHELERPHLIARDGLYYLFWSTQRGMFAPGGPGGPTGLYGMVSDRFDGGWQPLNGTGLVAANPPEEPSQAYSWLVLDDLSVVSFIDYWGLEGRTPGGTPGLVRSRFGGTIAPRFRLSLSGERSRIV